MNISKSDLTKRLDAKLVEGINALIGTKEHLTSYEKDLESTVKVQLKNAKSVFKEKRQEVMDAMVLRERLLEAKKEETVRVVAEWKAKHEQQKLEQRAKRAEDYADVCVTLATYYVAETELAILEAIAARQDATR